MLRPLSPKDLEVWEYLATCSRIGRQSFMLKKFERVSALQKQREEIDYQIADCMGWIIHCQRLLEYGPESMGKAERE